MAAAAEEEAGAVDRVREIDAAVAVPVDECQVARIGARAVAARKRNARVDKKWRRDAEEIGEIDAIVLVAVAGNLSATHRRGGELAA